MPLLHSVSIGNDIVDMAHPQPALHERFFSRVLTARERSAVGDDSVRLWTAWAAKEAAYKTLKRLAAEIYFSPRSIEFDFERRVATYCGTTLPCRVEIGQGHAAVWCATSDMVLDATVHAVLGSPDDNATLSSDVSSSVIVRQFAAATIAVHEALQPDDVQFSDPHPGRVPTLLLCGKPGAGLVSFSHHGRFSSFCYLSQNRYAILAEGAPSGRWAVCGRGA